MRSLEAALALLGAAVLLRSPAAGQFLAWLVEEPPGHSVAAPPSECARVAMVVDRAARVWADRPRCLSRAAAVGWLLRRQGVPVALRFGVRRIGAAIEGHAWLELAGQIIYDWSSMAAACAPLVPARSPGGR